MVRGRTLSLVTLVVVQVLGDHGFLGSGGQVRRTFDQPRFYQQDFRQNRQTSAARHQFQQRPVQREQKFQPQIDFLNQQKLHRPTDVLPSPVQEVQQQFPQQEFLSLGPASRQPKTLQPNLEFEHLDPMFFPSPTIGESPLIPVHGKEQPQRFQPGIQDQFDLQEEANFMEQPKFEVQRFQGQLRIEGKDQQRLQGKLRLQQNEQEQKQFHEQLRTQWQEMKDLQNKLKSFEFKQQEELMVQEKAQLKVQEQDKIHKQSVEVHEQQQEQEGQQHFAIKIEEEIRDEDIGDIM